MDLLITIAVAVLGLQAGALLAEALVLVPSWKSLAPEDFLAWYRRHGTLLLRFFGPLEVAAALLALAAALASGLVGSPGALLLGIAGALALLVLAAFPLYFQRANASFSDGTLEPGDVAAELRRWSRWHWGRVLAATLAFAAAVVAR